MDATGPLSSFPPPTDTGYPSDPALGEHAAVPGSARGNAVPELFGCFGEQQHAPSAAATAAPDAPLAARTRIRGHVIGDEEAQEFLYVS